MKSLSSISSCVSHNEKGILVQSHTPFPVLNSEIGYVYTISALAGLSYGPIMKQLEAADRTEDISDMRSLNTALLSYYAANNGQYPDNLQQLFEQEFLDDERFITYTDRELHYIKGLDAGDGDKVIVYTTPNKNDIVIYALVDGRVLHVPSDEFDKILAKQKK